MALNHQMSFKNKVIWITGASSGIGEALAYEFAKVGARLILSSRNLDELKRVELNCSLPENNILILPLDLENHDDYSNEVNSVINKFGVIDILVNNGGISSRALIKDSSLDIDKKLMNINYFGTISLTKAILPYMLEKKSGHIVVMSSIMGKFSAPLRSAYSASKHALHGYFESLRIEIWKDNIYVTLICPGFVKTRVSINAITADGSALGLMDPGQENGMMPDVLAKKVLKAIRKKKMEIIIGGKEKIGVTARRLYPPILYKSLKKMKFQ